MPDRDQWILTGPCGCPFGVMEGTVARNEGEAFAEMYDYNRSQMRDARDRGMEIKLISFEEYTNKYYDQMFEPCPH
jgi:hypothetical protein